MRGGGDVHAQRLRQRPHRLFGGGAIQAFADTSPKDTKSKPSKKDKKSESGKMSVNDDDASDDEAGDDEGNEDEFEVVERGGVRRLIRRVRR